MAQEEKAKEPTVKFTVKAGLPSAPQTKEVEVPQGDIKPWDLDSWRGVRADGQAPPAPRGPAQGHRARASYTYDVKLPGMLYGRMIGAAVPAGEIVSIDTSAGRGAAGREGRVDGRAEDDPLRRPGRGGRGRGLAGDRRGRGAAGEGDVQGQALHHELREAMKDDAPLVFGAAETPRGKDIGRTRATWSARGRRAAGAAAAAATSRRASPRRKPRSRRPTTAPSTPTRRSRRTASSRRGRATSSRSTPRRRASSRCARASPRPSSSTARTCACSASTWAAASAASSARRRAAARSRWSPASSRRRRARR